MSLPGLFMSHGGCTFSSLMQSLRTPGCNLLGDSEPELPSSAAAKLLTHGNNEITSVYCCFKLLCVWGLFVMQ